MAQFFDSQTRTFPASAAIGQFTRVTLAANGTVAQSAIGENEIGIAQTPAFAAGDLVTVRMRTAQGTHKAVAAAAIARGAAVFSAAAGRVSVSASTSFRIGTALEASTANGDIIEIVYLTPGVVVP